MGIKRKSLPKQAFVGKPGRHLLLLDILSLEPLGAFDYIERNIVAFGQRLEATAANSGKMDKNIATAIILLDKTETLALVEPLYLSRCH